MNSPLAQILKNRTTLSIPRGLVLLLSCSLLACSGSSFSEVSQTETADQATDTPPSDLPAEVPSKLPGQPVVATETPQSPPEKTASDAGTRPSAVEEPAPIASPIAPAIPVVQMVPNPQIDFINVQRPTESGSIREEASRLAEYLTKRFDQVADAYELRARMHFMLGERVEAAESWKQALAREPDYFFAHAGLGKLALDAEEFEEAIEYLTRAAEGLPDVREVHHDLASAFLKSGDVKASIAVLQNFATTHETSAETHLTLGHTLLADKQYETARVAFERTLELSPDAARAMEGLGRVLARLGERERARELLTQQRELRAAQNAPKSDEEQFQQELDEYAYQYAEFAKVFLAHSDVATAEKVLRKAVLMDPHNMAAWTNLISIPQSKSRFVDAAEIAEQMVEHNPDSASAFYALGLLQVKARNLEGAVKNLAKATELAPQDYKGFQTLARLLVQNRVNVADSIRIAQKAVDLGGAGADYELLAQAYALNGKLEDAKENLAKAVELEPDNQQFQQAFQQLNAFIASQAK